MKGDDDEEEVELATVRAEDAAGEDNVDDAEPEEEHEPMMARLAHRSSPPVSPTHAHRAPTRGVPVPIRDPPPSGSPPIPSGGAASSSGASVHMSKAPSDLHLWVEPGLAEPEVQRERKQAKRREALSGLLHRPTVPCLAWLRRYNPRRDFLWDFQAGGEADISSDCHACVRAVLMCRYVCG